MKIHYCKLHRLNPEVEKDAVFHADASELLAVSSFLTLHAPATAETIGSSMPGRSSYCQRARSS